MSIEKKTKLIYSGELMIFAILFAVVATLEVLGIIGKNETMLTIYNWITIFGGTWLIVDFFWVLFSKKRRAKNSLLDKAMLVPLGIYVIAYDILCFAGHPLFGLEYNEFRRMMMAIGFYYLAAAYLFQSIFHYFHPIPAIVEAIEEEKREKDPAPAPIEENTPVEENKDDEEKPQ